MNIWLIPILALFVTFSTTHASIGGYISLSDKKKFLQVLAGSFKVEGDDVASSYYGAKGIKLLSEPYDKKYAADNCPHIKKNWKPTANLESTFNALSTWSLLGCQGSLHTPATIKEISAVLETEKSSLSDLRHAAESLSLLKQPLPNPTKLAQLVQTKLKEDDSLPSVGQALHLAALLGDAGKFAQDRVEDVVVQADEVDGRILQWEGGLTTTSLLITGLLRLPGAAPFTPVQAEKLGNYLLTRKTVQSAKGVWALLEAATALAASGVSPVSVSVVGSSQVTVDKPQLRVQVSDIFGRALKPAPGAVVAKSVKRSSDDSVVLSNQPLAAGSAPTEFVLGLKLEPGFYRVDLSVGSNHAASFSARVSGPLSIESLEMGVSDADGGSALKLVEVKYPAKLGKALQADAGQRLVVKFGISRTVHQAFLRMYSGRKEILFVAEQDNSKVYKVEVNLAKELSQSGTFEMELILGDAIVTNPIRWQLGSIEVNLGQEATESVSTRGPKPEIKHLFRPAEKRPAETVSLFFTALTAAPLLVLLVTWGKIGINFGNFTPLALPFHLGFGASLALFTLFWLKLDMFVTCAWLIPIGGFTFLSGHKLLSHIARSRKQEKPEK